MNIMKKIKSGISWRVGVAEAGLSLAPVMSHWFTKKNSQLKMNLMPNFPATHSIFIYHEK